MVKKHLNVTIFALVIILFSGCSIIETNYSFYHHGTESIKTNSNFKYVEYNVKGKAKTTYYPNKLRKKQETVKDGLIAAAKENLNKNYPLGDNQAFANLSIDVLDTRKGQPVYGGGVEVSAITIEVVISADIIEYY